MRAVSERGASQLLVSLSLSLSLSETRSIQQLGRFTRSQVDMSCASERRSAPCNAAIRQKASGEHASGVCQ